MNSEEKMNLSATRDKGTKHSLKWGRNGKVCQKLDKFTESR